MTGTKELGALQQMMNDLAGSRKTPYGTPIPWTASPVTKFGSAVAPAYGAANQVEILEYQTPQNFFSLICGLVLGFSGPGPIPVPGDVIYTIDIDRPLVNPLGLGYIEKDYGSIQFPLGNFTVGWQWPVEFRHKNGEVLRIKGQTVAHVTVGPTNFLTAAIFGWQWPIEGWE